MKKAIKNSNGLVRLAAIIIGLLSILAGTIYYENNITASVARADSNYNERTHLQLKLVNDIHELSQLNEGWYRISNGFVYHLDTFDSYVPLYIKVKNLQQQNGLLVIDENGVIRFSESFDGLA